MRNDGKARGADLRERTKQFALNIIRLSSRLNRSMEAQVIARQLMRSGTSVGAQYREADRARSTAEFISKMESALQELSETEYWLELLAESGLAANMDLNEVISEARQLTAIFVASIRTAKMRRSDEKNIPHSAF
jgi:four helix bundle protein